MRRARKHLSEKFGKAVALARLEAGVTQEVLAGRAGLHRTYISLVERGKRSPTLDAVESIARALTLSASELLRRAEGGRS